MKNKKEFFPIKARWREDDWIYFMELKREKIFAKGLTKKEYQAKWCRTKNENRK